MNQTALTDRLRRSPRIALGLVALGVGAVGMFAMGTSHAARPKFAGVSWNSSNGNLTAITEDGDIYYSEVYMYNDGRPPARIWQRGVNVADETQAWDEIRQREQQAK